MGWFVCNRNLKKNGLEIENGVLNFINSVRWYKGFCFKIEMRKSKNYFDFIWDIFIVGVRIFL